MTIRATLITISQLSFVYALTARTSDSFVLSSSFVILALMVAADWAAAATPPGVMLSGQWLLLQLLELLLHHSIQQASAHMIGQWLLQLLQP